MLGEITKGLVKSNEELVELVNKKISEGAKVMSLKDYLASAEDNEEKHFFDPLYCDFSSNHIEEILEDISEDEKTPYAVFGCSETMYDYIDEPYYSKNPTSILPVFDEDNDDEFLGVKIIEVDYSLILINDLNEDNEKQLPESFKKFINRE